MNHISDDDLLLLAYGEHPASQASTIESHISACAECRDKLAQLERGLAMLEFARPPRRRPAVSWAGVALAAAAVLAGVVFMRSHPSRDPGARWTPTMSWSATAGYVTGGKAMIDLDAQLTRLEQERHYGLPN